MAKLKQVIESYAKVEKLRRELLVSQIVAVLIKKRTDNDKKYDKHYQAIAEELQGKDAQQALKILTRMATEGFTYEPWAVRSGDMIPKNKIGLPKDLFNTLRELVIE